MRMNEPSGTMNGPNGDYQQPGQFNPYSSNSIRGYPPNSQSRVPGMPGQIQHSNTMMPPTSANYNPNQQRMASSSNIPQGGTTPTLNQLLQTPNSGQRYPSPGYGDYNMGQTKNSNQDVMSGGQGYGNQSWGNQQRPVNPYQQQQMQANPAFRSQVSVVIISLLKKWN